MTNGDKRRRQTKDQVSVDPLLSRGPWRDLRGPLNSMTILLDGCTFTMVFNMFLTQLRINHLIMFEMSLIKLRIFTYFICWILNVFFFLNKSYNSINIFTL